MIWLFLIKKINIMDNYDKYFLVINLIVSIIIVIYVIHLGRKFKKREKKFHELVSKKPDQSKKSNN